MAEMWYYTTEGKQMDPVTMRELKRLVGDGVLKPTDMVWKDGMARWIRASSVKELFPDPTSSLDQFFKHAKDNKANVISAPIGPLPSTEPTSVKPAPLPAPADEVDAPHAQKKRRSSKEEDDDRPAPRRPQPSGGGSSTGIIIALVLGALLILGALGVGVVILIGLNQISADAKINPNNLIKGEHKYELRLNNNTHDTRKFSFRKDVEYEFIIKTEPKEVDVDLYIFHANGNVETHDDLPAADCYLRWIPRADGEYRVEVRNLDHDGPATSKVTIREFKEQKNNQDKVDPKEDNLPADTLEGSGLKPMTPSPKKEEVQKFRVRGGHPASFKFVPTNKGPASDFNIIVVKDSNPDHVIKQDVGPEPTASVNFTLQNTEIVRVRVIKDRKSVV